MRGMISNNVKYGFSLQIKSIKMQLHVTLTNLIKNSEARLTWFLNIACFNRSVTLEYALSIKCFWLFYIHVWAMYKYKT